MDKTKLKELYVKIEKEYEEFGTIPEGKLKMYSDCIIQLGTDSEKLDFSRNDFSYEQKVKREIPIAAFRNETICEEGDIFNFITTGTSSEDTNFDTQYIMDNILEGKSKEILLHYMSILHLVRTSDMNYKRKNKLIAGIYNDMDEVFKSYSNTVEIKPSRNACYTLDNIDFKNEFIIKKFIKVLHKGIPECNNMNFNLLVLDFKETFKRLKDSKEKNITDLFMKGYTIDQIKVLLSIDHINLSRVLSKITKQFKEIY